MKTCVLSKLLCIAAATFTMTAKAQQPVCHNDGSGVDAAACAHEDFVRADAQLNDAYHAALNMMGAGNERADARAALMAAQREWIRFRDADCQVQDRIFQHGTIRKATVQSCLKALTEQRTKELKQLWLP
ncbi:lysozyme inhibitor LprI family protein [Burkholderia cepacia]|uniref:lysozyme inhibitor LprI family protein n=1 Tax=Burkholderia cepacia TaxID=292 RepID=UPI0009BA7857|nr:lysozyme inhibitor LprI family protein [Burkholderia cepacia]